MDKDPYRLTGTFPSKDAALAALSVILLLLLPFFMSWSNPGGLNGGFVPWYAVTLATLAMHLARACLLPNARYLSLARLLAVIGAATCVLALGHATAWYLSLPQR